jgi:hypothetical protein
MPSKFTTAIPHADTPAFAPGPQDNQLFYRYTSSSIHIQQGRAGVRITHSYLRQPDFLRELPVYCGFGSCKIIPVPCPDSTDGYCPFHLSISARLFSMRRSSKS